MSLTPGASLIGIRDDTIAGQVAYVRFADQLTMHENVGMDKPILPREFPFLLVAQE